MDWRFGVLVLLLGVVVAGVILTPPEDALVVVPERTEEGDGRIAPVEIPLAPLSGGGAAEVELPAEQADEDPGILTACRPVHERLVKLADEAAGAKVGDAARAKFEGAALIQWCSEVVSLSDDALKARLTSDLAVSL